MNSSEFRIGNHVSSIDRGGKVHIPQTHPFKIIDISFFKIDVCQINEIFAQAEKRIILDIRDVCGIPLTEDWLVRFGLNEPKGVHNDNFSGLISVGMLYDGCVFYIGNTEVTYIKYVHQLQNLYFALTQKELAL